MWRALYTLWHLLWVNRGHRTLFASPDIFSSYRLLIKALSLFWLMIQESFLCLEKAFVRKYFQKVVWTLCRFLSQRLHPRGEWPGPSHDADPLGSALSGGSGFRLGPAQPLLDRLGSWHHLGGFVWRQQEACPDPHWPEWTQGHRRGSGARVRAFTPRENPRDPLSSVGLVIFINKHLSLLLIHSGVQKKVKRQ